MDQVSRQFLLTLLVQNTEQKLILILLLELPCSFVRHIFLHHLTRTISRQRKELPEICWCQIAWILEGFLDFEIYENCQNAKNYQKGQK